MGKLTIGINDLQTVNPTLAKEWDFDKNGELTPSEIAAGSHQKAWWICPICGHSWCAQINARNLGNGCPECGHRKASDKKKAKLLNGSDNSLLSLNPLFLVEWDYEKNKSIQPFNVTSRSSQKVWWRCSKCGASYYSSIVGRTVEGKGCAVCAGVKVQQGINDLATINPLISSEWDYENNNLIPTQVTANNNRKVWWICSICGNRWIASISDRNAGTGCPKCAKTFHTSFPEQAVFWYLRKIFPDAVNGYKPLWLKKHEEIDIYLPSIGVGIEYDGFIWHKSKANDVEKSNRIVSNGVYFIRIRESGLPLLQDNSFIISVESTDKQYLYLNTVIYKLFCHVSDRFGIINIPNIDIDRDRLEIISSYMSQRRSCSLTSVCPEIASEWNYDKNGSLMPQQVSYKSEIKVFWKCSHCGFEWKTSVAVRTSGHNCPACAGLTLRTGYNDFATMRPELVSEWDSHNNGELTPSQIAYRSNKKVWWRCKRCKSVYQQRVADKSDGRGCPICSGKIVVAGINDLKTGNPLLAQEWDNQKNGTLSPSDVTPQSNKKVWWLCSNCGYSWYAAIYSRNGGKRGCPNCHHYLA